MSREAEPSVENKRLDSWKEIAAFFGRDERTVKRWEKSRALPVHRVPGTQRSGVFAYTHELTRWLNSPSAISDESEELESPSESSPAFSSEISPASVEPTASVENVKPGDNQPREWWIAAVVVVIVFAIGSLLVFHSRNSRSALVQTSIKGDGIPPVHATIQHDPRAVDFYLKGRYYWNRRTGDSLNRAVDSFTQAIVIDPNYAEAYAGLADSYNLMREYTSMPESEAYPRAIAAANKAVALDDSLAEAHRALAFALFYGKWEIPEAEQQYQRAIALDPKDAIAHHWYATSMLSLGHPKEALLEIEKARALSPASPSILADRALIRHYAGDRAGSTEMLKEMEATEPGFQSPPRYLAIIYFETGDYGHYLIEQKRLTALTNDPEDLAVADAADRGWRRSGQRGFLESLASAQKEAFDGGKASGYRLAYTCMLLGRKKDAVQYLHAAFTRHDANLFSITRDPFTRELGGDSDFEKLKHQILAYTERRVDSAPVN